MTQNRAFGEVFFLALGTQKTKFLKNDSVTGCPIRFTQCLLRTQNLDILGRSLGVGSHRPRMDITVVLLTRLRCVFICSRIKKARAEGKNVTLNYHVHKALPALLKKKKRKKKWFLIKSNLLFFKFYPFPARAEIVRCNA
jgi:hypothetical protein